MEEGGDEGGAAREEVTVEEEGVREAEKVLGHGLALIQAVVLGVTMEGVQHLDEGWAGDGVVGKDVEDDEEVEGMAGGGGDVMGDVVDGQAGDGGVGVDDIQGGVG